MGAVMLQRPRRPATSPDARRAPWSPRGAYHRVCDRARACQRVPAACARHASGVPDDQVMTSPDLMIQAEGLRKHFGSTQALDGVDLAVTAGTVLGVLGPNGAGKTTAVRIIA